ncbi:TPA: hypothetical protein ACS5XR_005189, partial [Salmonella enterica]
CWLTGAGVVSGSPPGMAEVLYPTLGDAVLSLLLSVPVLLLCAVYPLRGRYKMLSLLTFGAVYLGQLVETARLVSVMLRSDAWYSGDTDLVMSCLCAYSAVMLWITLTPRLWTVFGGEEGSKWP